MSAFFWLQKGFKKASKSNPRLSQAPYFSIQFSSFLMLFLAQFWSIFGSILEPRSSPEALFFGHFFGPTPRMAPGGSLDPLLVDFWSDFRAQGLFFGPLVRCFFAFSPSQSLSRPHTRSIHQAYPQKSIHALPSLLSPIHTLRLPSSSSFPKALTTISYI